MHHVIHLQQLHLRTTKGKGFLFHRKVMNIIILSCYIFFLSVFLQVNLLEVEDSIFDQSVCGDCEIYLILSAKIWTSPSTVNIMLNLKLPSLTKFVTPNYVMQSNHH